MLHRCFIDKRTDKEGKETEKKEEGKKGGGKKEKEIWLQLLREVQVNLACITEDKWCHRSKLPRDPPWVVGGSLYLGNK